MPFRTTLSIVFWTETEEEARDIIEVVESGLPETPQPGADSSTLSTLEVREWPPQPEIDEEAVAAMNESNGRETA